MAVFFEPTQPIARKEHECMASVWISNCWNRADIATLTFKEIRAFKRAEINNFKILKGQQYYRQGGIWDGKLSTFKAIPEIHYICQKYSLYPDPNEY